MTEQFTTTFTMAGYAAILLALPVILYQLYAFILPAFSPRERRVAKPLLLMVPALFIGGVAFGYFFVLEPATQFLLNFNSDEFTTAVRARDYYSFVSLTLISLGLLYQVPVGILALTRLGITTPAGLRRNRRYAILGCAVLAALLPTIDPVTLILEMVPLIVLYEASILLAQAFGQPRDHAAARPVAADACCANQRARLIRPSHAAKELAASCDSARPEPESRRDTMETETRETAQRAGRPRRDA